ncbi:MAG: GNAT family N-acetyltransferase [Phycisphaerales bacterium]
MKEFVLTTERLIIREPRIGDAELLMPMFSDPVAMRYIGNGAPRDLKTVQESIDKRIAYLTETGTTLFTVILQLTGEVIGDCGIFPYNWEGPEIELAYRFRQTAWGNGYASEAGRAVIDAGWRDTEINELLGVTDLRNHASQRVLTKLGFENLGTIDRYYDEELSHFRLRRPQ